MQDTLLSRRNLLAGTTLALGGMAVMARWGGGSPDRDSRAAALPELPPSLRIMPYDAAAYAIIGGDGPVMMMR